MTVARHSQGQDPDTRPVVTTIVALIASLQSGAEAMASPRERVVPIPSSSPEFAPFGLEALTVDFDTVTLGGALLLNNGEAVLSEEGQVVLRPGSAVIDETLQGFVDPALPDRDFVVDLGEFDPEVLTTLRGEEGLSLEVNGTDYLALDIDGEISLPMALLLEEVVDFPLSVIAEDIRRDGFSSRVVPINPIAGDTALETLVRLNRGETIEIPNDRVSVTPPSSTLDVGLELPSPLEIELASQGECVAAVEDWPFDTADVARVIRRDRDLLARIGLAPLRARIVVADTGLPATILDHPRMHAMIPPNPAELMAGGEVLELTADSSAVCADPDGQATSVALGSIPSADLQMLCGTTDPAGMMAPPVSFVPDQADAETRYEAAHGALVATLAAGGPDLLETDPGLPAHLAISMARIFTQGQNGVVLSSVNDLVAAIAYADQTDAEVLNLSLRVSTRVDRDWKPALDNFLLGHRGLIVAAAGNAGATLLDGTPSIPGALASVNGLDDAIVVGGVMLGPEGQTIPWPNSNGSGRLVDIAAPAIGVASLGLDGTPICLPGTSISAPQVSFVAGMLFSLGYVWPAEVKRRILATADEEVPLVAQAVRRGRVLDVANALDVYVDLVWPAGENEPIRGLILGRDGQPGWRQVQVCDAAELEGTLARSGGAIDTRRLIYWSRLPTGMVEIWYQSPQVGGSSITPLGTSCLPGSGTFSMRDLQTGEVREINLDDIDRLVPSRFRLGKEVLAAATDPPPP